MDLSAVHTSFTRRRWVCLIAAMVICVCAGFGYAWSVLQNPIITRFGWADSGVALAYTITVLCSTMAPLIFGGVIRRLSTRLGVVVGAVLFGVGLFLTGLMTQLWQLYLFYGVIAGLGVGFIYPSMMAYVVRLFPDRSGMASGLGTAAYGSGAILWAPTAAALMEGVGMTRAFQVLGVLFAAVILVGSLLLADPPEGFQTAMAPSPNGTQGGISDLRRGQMVRTGTFWIMVIVFTCGLVAGVIVISQASPILQQSLGYSSATAAIFVSVFSACNMAGRFLWGSLSDKLGLVNTAGAVFLLCILSMGLLAVVGAEVPVLILMGVAASCYGGLASILTPLTAKTFGPRYITENYGVMYVVFGLASLIGPSLATTFKSMAGGSYTGAYLTAAVLAVVGLILSRFLKPVTSKGE
ncbi:OFA family MFS transporter [Pseudoflavonifractor phocaeensis]|uniref:L-lactate MFS transporter n=1 Tax=Pseudoflavonifractor phocaeensis TaxID=1870988 RepID=UPI001955FEC9|nr:OFA family MFS transporter [Pseudoflavonifractor phocaeensis]MBM6924387.1 OFA family MFS transporter [Pseudoflavonifractor phocaeensis]